MKSPLWLIVLASIGCSGSGPSRASVPLERLTASVPTAKWLEQSQVQDDFDCDGRPDVAYLGHQDSDVLVGIVGTSAGEAQVLRFGVAAGRQDAICAEPATLTVESMDYDPADDPELGSIEGFIPSATCRGGSSETGSQAAQAPYCGL
jgi:hypothetical protein